MIRVVLAVVFAAGLLSVGLQAAESGRQRHDETLADDRVASLATTVERFAAANDPVPPGREGATLVTRLHVPDDVAVVLGGGDDDRPIRGQVAWHPVGSTDDTHVRWVDVALRNPAESGPLVLQGGRHRLRLSLVRVDGHTAVLVRRFTNENGTSPRHAGTRFGSESRLPV